MADDVRKRSITIAGHATSVSLEEAFWQELKQIAKDQKRSMNDVIADIDEARTTNLSSAIRVYVLNAVKARG